jgi:hypothetical protein
MRTNRVGLHLSPRGKSDVPAQLDALRQELVGVAAWSTILSAAVTGVLFLVAVIVLT